jgi:predicted AAA+ superfamily ATPase
MLPKESLYAIVKDQQGDAAQVEGTVPRELLPAISGFRGQSALVVKGIRRCGKSTLLLQAMRASYGNNFCYFNFDDERAIGFEAGDFQKLMEVFAELYGGKNALFLDEVQKVRGWELFVNRMLREGRKIYVTGSNADLLSSELGTHLTGRHTDFELFPFSFGEFLSARGAAPPRGRGFSTKEAAVLSRHFNEYMVLGGMPEAATGKNPPILRQVVGDIAQKDIVRRYRVRKPDELRAVLQFLLSNVANRMTFRSISESFGMKKSADRLFQQWNYRNSTTIKSPNTARKYFGYAKEAYLFFAVGKYERKLKVFDKNPKKIYCMDNGIVAKNSVALSEMRGALLENLVAVELLRRGRRFHYYVSKSGHETDFVVVSQAKRIVEAIQVCASPSAHETRVREERALLQALRETGLGRGKVITVDFERMAKINGKTVEYVPAWKWLLQQGGA